MSSPDNTKPDEGEDHEETLAARGDTSASAGPNSVQKPSQPAAEAGARRRIEDIDFVPRFSEVRSRHGSGDDDEQTKILPSEQPNIGTQSETSASVLSAAALAIEMTAASSFDALPVTEVGENAKGFGDISIPESRPEVSSSHLNPEFGYHNVSEPKDGPRQPPAQLPPPPKAVTQYQNHLMDPSTSKVDSLISQSENLDSIWEVHDRSGQAGTGESRNRSDQPSNTNQSGRHGSSTVDGGTDSGMHFSPHGYDASSMSPLSPKQELLNLPDDAAASGRTPPASGRASGSFRPDHQLAQAQYFAEMQTPFVDEIGLARKNRSAQIRSSLYWVVKEARLVTHGVFSDYETPRGPSYAEANAAGSREKPNITANNLASAHQPPKNSRELASPAVPRDNAVQSDFAPPVPGALAKGPDSPPVPKPSQRLLTQNSLEAVRNEAPPAKLRAVPHIAGSADYLVNRDESPTIRFPEDAWDLQSESQTHAQSPTNVSPQNQTAASAAAASVPPAPASASSAPAEPVAPSPVTSAPAKSVPAAPVSAPSPPEERKFEQIAMPEPQHEQAITADGVYLQNAHAERARNQTETADRIRDQAITSERVRDQGTTAEHAREQSTTSERRLRTTDQHKTDQRKTDQRTTRDGMIKVPLLGFVKKDDLKRQAITIGSVVVLCLASAALMYDTINSNRKQTETAVEKSETPSPDVENQTRSEIPAPTGKTTAKFDDAPEPAAKEPALEAELAKAFKLEQQLNYIDSMNTFDKVIERDKGKNPKSLHGRGRVLTKLRLYDRALDDLESADKLDPHNINILIDLAAVKYLLGDYSDSAKDYEKILAEHPKDADALYGRGISYAGMGKSKEAIADFEDVIKLKPRYDKAYRQMCTAYLALNQSDKAESTITAAMNSCGADADLYFSRALSRYQSGRKDSALEDYNEAIRLSPDRKEYYNDRGFVQMDLGKFEDARKDFNHALEIDPKYKLASDNLRRLRKLEKSDKSIR
ncbi:tetratricopeptide repeat protein [Candidatus Obscuribacterales bacterium]|nr:tetratricopeptide repeat protein [Candidatus Obscuribacterales bacterium]